MSRRVFELQDKVPQAPAALPPEPIPSFTHMIHDTYTTCAKGHVYSAMSYRARIAAWQSSYRDVDDEGNRSRDPLPLSFVQQTPKCPHCERTEWREKEADGVVAHAAHDRQMSFVKRVERGDFDQGKPRRLTLGRLAKS